MTADAPTSTSSPRRAARWTIALLVLGCIAAAVFVAAHGLTQKTQANILLVSSGDTAGWITPCGCTVNQSGGLPRRGAYLADLRRHAQVVYVDTGGAIRGTSPYQQAKLTAILRGEVLMGVSAHNLGGPELALGPAVLAELSRTTNIPFLSANTTDPSGQPLAPAIRTVTVQGRRIALTGVVSPAFATADIQVAAPRPAILQALRTHLDQYDTLVVLAYLPDAELESFAADMPEADVILAGAPNQTIPPRRTGPTLLAASSHQGKFLVEMALPAKTAGPAVGRLVEMDSGHASDPSQSANYQTFLRDLATRDFPASQTGFVPALAADTAAYRVAGTASCQSCHTADYHLWQQQSHARAWQGLIARAAQVDPECQRCHTTGYGRPGGFETIAASAPMFDVGCEDCHGPGQAHVQNPSARMLFQAQDQCLRCHDAENSPKFNFPSYWQTIRHGPRPATSAPPASQLAPEVKP